MAEVKKVPTKVLSSELVVQEISKEGDQFRLSVAGDVVLIPGTGKKEMYLTMTKGSTYDPTSKEI